MRRRVLYAVVCGSPVARDVGRLVTLGQHDGWEVCVVTTPEARKYVDVQAVAAQTRHTVRTFYKNPGDPDVLPPPDAFIVAPATVNTVNKWAAGIADTLALGLLVEGQGKGLPIVAMPYTNSAMAAHPAFQEAIARLRSWGVTVLFGDDVIRLHPPGTGERHLHTFPWGLGLDALRAMTGRAGGPPAPAPPPTPATTAGGNAPAPGQPAPGQPGLNDGPMRAWRTEGRVDRR